MSGAEDKGVVLGSETLSWNAYELAKDLNDLGMLPELKSYLDDEVNQETRCYAYDILGFIGKNTGSQEVLNILTNSIKREDNHDENLHRVLCSLHDTEMMLEEGLGEVIFYAFDERELVRGAAIMLLSRYTVSLEKVKETLLEVIEFHYDDYDLKYAVQSLKAQFPKTYKELVDKKKQDMIENEGNGEAIERIKAMIQIL
jgi:hypothetical protein